MNEAKTENIVRERFRANGYFDNNSIIVEEKKSDSPRINKLLKNASKSGSGAGYPEFVVHSKEYSDFLIVVECKANPLKHKSETLDKYSEYAVDGVLLYASYLSKEFDVLAVAVSGENEDSLLLSHYLCIHGAQKAVEYTNARDIVPMGDYYQALISSDEKFRQDYDALLDFSRTLNNQLHSKKIPEAERGFLISGILIALKNKAFIQSFKAQRTAKQLATNLLETIRGEFESVNLPQERRESLVQAFSFISHSPALIEDKEYFISLINNIDQNINAFMRTHEYYDTIGQFYVEFLRYANNDKGLGIVLTPRHIAELFADLAEVDRNSTVFDNCCGTAGLLIAAMESMVQDAGPDQSILKKIQNERLYGIEFQPNIYALAVSNMVLHGDGKTNIYRGDCFQDGKRIVSRHRPTIGLLNPPYKNKTVKEDKEELEFVLNNLDCLEQNGRCVAIVPITCATAPSGEIAKWKRVILGRHTLEAVMSMPIDLFHNSKTTVVTCIMVFTAHRQHPSGKKTWFGYWRHDGFVKTKHRGRVDWNGTWKSIKQKWVNVYRNREVIEGFSVLKEVNGNDEWCAEAYLETNYETINQASLLTRAKIFVLKNAMLSHAFRSSNET